MDDGSRRGDDTGVGVGVGVGMSGGGGSSWKGFMRDWWAKVERLLEARRSRYVVSRICF